MGDLPIHTGFIVASYLATLAVVAGLILWVVLDGRALRRKIGELEARGIRRRSDPEQGKAS